MAEDTKDVADESNVERDNQIEAQTPEDRAVDEESVQDESTQESSPDLSRQKQADEQFCSSCGETIKKEAEICPECGVRQSSSRNDFELQEKKKIANKDITTVMVVSFLLTPVGYWMVGKTMLAIVNFLTLNYFLLGWLIVPFHTRKIIKDTRTELAAQGEY